MPNHVHLLFTPLSPVDKLMEAWKAQSARLIGIGPIWQRNCRDTIIRDLRHFENVLRHIRNNPVKAKLPEGEYTLWEGRHSVEP